MRPTRLWAHLRRRACSQRSARFPRPSGSKWFLTARAAEGAGRSRISGNSCALDGSVWREGGVSESEAGWHARCYRSPAALHSQPPGVPPHPQAQHGRDAGRASSAGAPTHRGLGGTAAGARQAAGRLSGGSGARTGGVDCHLRTPLGQSDYTQGPQA